jgi:hypothetical protein
MADYNIYAFRCDNEGSGEIYVAPDDEPRWITRTVPRRPWMFYGTIRLAPFSVCEPAGSELLVFKRERRLPLARFGVYRDGERVGTVRQRSPLLNRYSI